MAGRAYATTVWIGLMLLMLFMSDGAGLRDSVRGTGGRRMAPRQRRTSTRATGFAIAEGDGPVLSETIPAASKFGAASASFSFAAKPSTTCTTSAGAVGTASGDVVKTEVFTLTNPNAAIGASFAFALDTPGGIQGASADTATWACARTIRGCR